MPVKTAQKALLSSALAAALVGPATAEAHTLSSTQTVRAHVRAADRELLKFESAVEANADARAARALARNRRQMRAASREARRVRRVARGVRGARRSAAVTSAVGLQADASSEVLAATIGAVGGGLQADVAASLQADLLTGAEALSFLTGLLGDLPATAQQTVVQAIGQLAQVQEVLTAVTKAIDVGKLTAAAEQSLAKSIAIALATIDAGVETLNALVGTVSALAVPLVQQALALATQQLPVLVQLLQDLAGSGLPGLPTLGGGSGSVEVGIDGSPSSVLVSGLCGVLPNLPVVGQSGC